MKEFMFPKEKKKKKRKKRRASIMQRKDGTCYLCRKLHGDWSRKQPIHEHHVFGGVANRPLSEEYGLKVYLCMEHHVAGPEAVHTNKEIMDMVRKDAQRKFEKEYDLDFREIFGKNYGEG